jgi:phospholipase C
MDGFARYTERAACPGRPLLYGTPGLVMDYYDGNTVTALWNYAQRYAMSDAAFAAGFGPASPAAVDLVSGETHGAVAVDPVSGRVVGDAGAVASPDPRGVGTYLGGADPAYDACSDGGHTQTSPLVELQGGNIGDLLDRRGVTWGWFQGGFGSNGGGRGRTSCGGEHRNVAGREVEDYRADLDPFQFYRSTSNPRHLAPRSEAAIGHAGRANHQYGLGDFLATLRAGNMPAVSFLQAPGYEDGAAGSSDPLDEQRYLVDTVNAIQRSRFWPSTAVVVTYDGSGGWYDHVPPPIVDGSHDPATDLAAECGAHPAAAGYQDRCGYGPRVPLLVISPYSRTDYVGHRTIAPTSVLRFIEDNWQTGRIGGSSLDAGSGGVEELFDFTRAHPAPLTLVPGSGAVAG